MSSSATFPAASIIEAGLLTLAWVMLWLKGSSRYFLQNFVDSGNLIGRGYHGFTAEELRAFAARVRPFFKSAEVRGID